MKLLEGIRASLRSNATSLAPYLRHGSATLLLGMGVHPKIVQERLGHHDIGTTMDIYSHVLPTMQEGMMKQLDRLFQQRPDG
ncbi:MAG TPA: tyrosine-type recombinase/integrase [Ktedonobacteraceae bacterium]